MIFKKKDGPNLSDMIRDGCTHKAFMSHRVGVRDGRNVFRCSTCGKQGVWDVTWSYNGRMNCDFCGQPDIKSVNCGCLAGFRKKKPK